MPLALARSGRHLGDAVDVENPPRARVRLLRGRRSPSNSAFRSSIIWTGTRAPICDGDSMRACICARSFSTSGRHSVHERPTSAALVAVEQPLCRFAGVARPRPRRFSTARRYRAGQDRQHLAVGLLDLVFREGELLVRDRQFVGARRPLALARHFRGRLLDRRVEPLRSLPEARDAQAHHRRSGDHGQRRQRNLERKTLIPVRLEVRRRRRRLILPGGGVAPSSDATGRGSRRSAHVECLERRASGERNERREKQLDGESQVEHQCLRANKLA